MARWYKRQIYYDWDVAQVYIFTDTLFISLIFLGLVVMISACHPLERARETGVRFPEGEYCFLYLSSFMAIYDIL